MNSVTLIGRLANDPKISNGETPVARFAIAIDRPVRQGAEKKADFPHIVVFGKQAENCERFLAKGRLVGIQGRIQTGSYTSKAGNVVYTTDVIADRVEFLEWGDRNDRPSQGRPARQEPAEADIPEGFQAVQDDDIPF